jgi:cyclopropane-fatty-acyl-phospholipid synthase
MEKQILSFLEAMKKGQLNVELPGGRKLIFGKEPQGLKAHIKIKDNNFFKRLILFGDIGFGESFEAGEWETEDLTSVISWMILNIDNNPAVTGSSKKTWILGLLKIINGIAHAWRDNNLLNSKKNISEHYDLGNDFFKLFLDPTMAYSSADFSGNESDLTSAQIRKFESLCALLKLKESDHLLEIGSGWGGFAKYAAEKYGCKITSITISEEQFKYVEKLIVENNLQKLIEIKLCDYRKITGSYDKIVSIEMLEAVGSRYYSAYFEACHRLLKKNGLLGLQVILCPDTRFKVYSQSVDWIQKYIFPGAVLPSLSALNQAVNKTGDLNLVELRDLGKSYVKTLSIWRDRLNAHIDTLKAMGRSENFIRRWNFYFSYCEAAFNMRNITVSQMLYSRPNNPNL